MSNNKVKEKNTFRNTILGFGVISILMFIFMFFNRALVDDGAFHIARLQALSEEISIDNIKPWMYSKTYFGTGYPLGVFYPDLFLYPFALLAKLGIDSYYCYIIMMMCINFASVASFYVCIRKILIDRECEEFEKISMVMSVAYLVFPYRLWDFYARMAIGECLFFIFFPIVMLGVYKLFYKREFGLELFFGMLGLIYSHILSTVIVIAVLIVFYLLNIKKIAKYPKIFGYTVINAILTMICSASVVLPILEMQQFSELYYATGTKTFGMLKDNVITILDNDIAAIVITVAVLAVCGVFAYKGNWKTKMLITIFLVIFMDTDLFCWGALENAFPFINIIQFPFRLLGVISIPSSILLGLVVYKHKPIYVSATAMILLMFIYLGVVQYISIENLDIYGQYSIGKGEYTNTEFRDYILKHGEIPNVKEEYKISQKGNEYIFETKDEKVVLPLSYYKGYKITDESKEYAYGKEQGMIKVEGVEGNNLKVVYEGTMIQKVSLIMSVVSFVLVCLVYGMYQRKVAKSK